MDAGEVDIDDEDEYHPYSLTPSQTKLLQPRSHIGTRIRSRATVDDAALIHCTLTQLTLKKELKQFDDEAHPAITKDLLQLHERKVVNPVHAHSLTDD